MTQQLRRFDRVAPWLVGGFVLSVALGGIYLTGQTIERSGADDAGERLASQIAASDASEHTLADETVDLTVSLAPFFVVYTEDGKPTSGNGYLDGALASVPVGVIEAAVVNGENRVSWQPAAGLRFAVVAVHDKDRVVLAGQSLAPSERRTEQLAALLALVWIVAMTLLVTGALLHRSRSAHTE